MAIHKLVTKTIVAKQTPTYHLLLLDCKLSKSKTSPATTTQQLYRRCTG